jgi:hypothetical protein
MAARFAGVSIVLGRIALTRTPWSITSAATVCAMVTTADFAERTVVLAVRPA